MKKCPDCRSDVRITYSDYHVKAAARQMVFIRDAKVYVCDSCGEQGLAIQALSGFNAEVKKLPENNNTPTYFAISHLGTWFRLPEKER